LTLKWIKINLVWSRTTSNQQWSVILNQRIYDEESSKLIKIDECAATERHVSFIKKSRFKFVIYLLYNYINLLYICYIINLLYNYVSLCAWQAFKTSWMSVIRKINRPIKRNIHSTISGPGVFLTYLFSDFAPDKSFCLYIYKVFWNIKEYQFQPATFLALFSLYI